MKALWDSIRVDVAVLAVIVIVLAQYPDQWAGLLCDLLGWP